MSFLNPLFLIALLAVAVPLLIHIFSRRRVPDVQFSTLRFLRRLERRSMRRINLLRLLLLVLRMAAIAMLALAFARPVIRGALASLFPPGGPKAACVLLDRSFSMRFEEQEGTLFERAGKRVEGILDHFDENDEVTVMLFDSSQEVLHASGRLDREAISASLAGASPSWAGTDLRSAVEAGRRVLRRSRREGRELFIVSDLQRSALFPAQAGGRGTVRDDGSGSVRGWERAGEDETEPSGTPGAVAYAERVFILPVQPETGTNASIEQVFTPHVVLHRGELTEVRVLLRNNSRELAARFPLSVLVDGQRIMEKEIEIQPDGLREERIVFPVERTGWIGGEVRKKTDRLPADDARFFTMNAREKIATLLVSDGDGFYLESALSPEDGEGDISLVTKGWRSVTTADLDRAEVIVLGPGAGPIDRDIEIFDRFISSGGRALVLVLPELVRTVSRLSGFDPGITFIEAAEGFVTISKPQTQPPFLSPFEDEDMTALSRLRFRTAPTVRNIPERAALLNFTNGRPFMWQESRGEGSIVFAAIDPRPEAGDLTLSPYFLPLVQQAVLATGPEPAAVEGYVIGSPVVWWSSFAASPLCRLPDGTELRPGRINGDSSPSVAGGGGGFGAGDLSAGKESGILIPAVETPGFVDIYDGDNLVGKVAVNPACRGESDLSCMSGREAADSLGLEHFAVLGEGDELASALYAAREGREASMPVFTVALLLFVLELFVSQRMRGETGAV